MSLLMRELFELELSGQPTKARLMELARMANLLGEDRLYEMARFQLALDAAATRQLEEIPEESVERVSMRELWSGSPELAQQRRRR